MLWQDTYPFDEILFSVKSLTGGDESYIFNESTGKEVAICLRKQCSSSSTKLKKTMKHYEQNSSYFPSFD